MKKKLSAAMMFMAAIALLNGCGQKSDEQKSDVQVQTQEEQVVSDNEAVTLPELSENRPMAYPPCVMIDGIVYQDTGYVSSMLGCGVMDGEITSEVDGTELPTENDQSNFGTGYAYQRGTENYVIVMMDGEPEIFQNTFCFLLAYLVFDNCTRTIRGLFIRHFNHLQLTITTEPFFILCNRITQIFFFYFSHTNNSDFHSLSCFSKSSGYISSTRRST